MTSRQIHDSQIRLVRAAAYMSDDRTERHAISSRAGTKPCPGCGAPKAFLWCGRCLMESRAA